MKMIIKHNYINQTGLASSLQEIIEKVKTSSSHQQGPAHCFTEQFFIRTVVLITTVFYAVFLGKWEDPLVILNTFLGTYLHFTLLTSNTVGAKTNSFPSA